jgi:hypothetical protein
MAGEKRDDEQAIGHDTAEGSRETVEQDLKDKGIE